MDDVLKKRRIVQKLENIERRERAERTLVILFTETSVGRRLPPPCSPEIVACFALFVRCLFPNHVMVSLVPRKIITPQHHISSKA